MCRIHGEHIDRGIYWFRGQLVADAHLGTQSGMTEPASMRDILVGLYIGWEQGKSVRKWAEIEGKSAENGRFYHKKERLTRCLSLMRYIKSRDAI